MRGDVAALNLHAFWAIKNLPDKISGLNLQDKSKHESKVFFLKKKDQIFKLKN